MNEVIAPAAAPKTNFTELNVRQTQGKPHFVRLNDNVVKRLERQLIDHPPVTGSERFGLLLGSIEPGNPCTILVEDFEPTPKLEERIGLWKPNPKSSQMIIGYYRSHREADFVFNPSDRGLFERCFAKGSRLALLVRPAGKDVGTAMFFLGDDGQLALDRATVEFPFNLRELGAEDAPGVASAQVPAPKPAVVAMKPAVLVAASAPKPAPGPTSQATPAPLVTAPAPVVAKPRRSGVATKLAVAGAVVIASVFGLSELHVFNGAVSQPQAQSKTAESAIVVESKPTAEPTAAPAEPPQAVKEPPATPKPQTAKAVVATTATTKPAAALPKKKSADDSAVPVTTPTQPALVAQNTQPNPIVVTQQQPPATLTQPRPVTLAPTTPVAPPAATLPTPAPSPKPTEVSVPITPPHAIRQFAPVLPDKVRKNIVGELVVRVKATVNTAGKVTSAETLSEGSPIPDALAVNAVNAVKQWQFEPARRGAEKVAGDVVLSFTFRK